MKRRHPTGAVTAKKAVIKLTEILPELLRLYEERSDYCENELPKMYADYPLVGPGEDPDPPLPQDAQIRELLERLPGDMVYQLILIMDLGLEHFGTQDLAEQFDAIKDDFGKPESARSFIVGLGSFASSLTDGLAKLEESQIDVDKLDDLLRKPPRVRK